MPDDEDRQQQVEELGSDGDDGLGDFEINDTTSEEQLERERSMSTSSEADDATDDDGEESQEDDKPDQPESEAPETDQPLDQGEQPQTPPEPQTPPARTYTQEEVSKMQSSWTREIQERQERIEKFDMDSAVEAQLQKLEQTWAPNLGEDEARRQVRDPRVRQELETRYRRDRQLEQLQQRVAHQEVQQGTDQLLKGMAGWIKQLKQEHGLNDTDVREMVELIPDATFERQDTYEQMGVRLAKLAAQRGKLRKGQRVPPENTKTRLESGQPSGNGRETAAQRIERLNFTPASEWSDADERFMRTGR